MTAKRVLLAPALALMVSGCTGPRPEGAHPEEVDYDPREVGLSPESWKGDILMDVRIWRELDQRLSEGTLHPSGITFSGEHPSCQNDGTPLIMWDFSNPAKHWTSVAREPAYYCPNLFHARTLIQTHAPERKWDLLWPADITVHPGENEEDDLVLEMMSDGTLPRTVRVSTVEFERLPSQRVLALLRSAGIEAHADLGSVRDDIYVPREDVDRALKALSSQTLRGLEIRRPPPARGGNP